MRKVIVWAAIVAALAVGGSCSHVNANTPDAAPTPDLSACQGDGAPTQQCLDQFSQGLRGLAVEWCNKHPFDSGCKYSNNPDPSQYN